MSDYPVVQFTQGNTKLIVFVAPVKDVWEHVSINRRVEDKDEGYQRALVQARVDKISKYLQAGNSIPSSILIAFEKGKYEIKDDKISFKKETDIGWVIDGQHRLAGAYSSGLDIMFPIVGILDSNIDDQIMQFITINREAKGVPTSLYYDLLKYLPKKTSADRTKERVSDIALLLKHDEESTFHGKIVVVTSPKEGEISLTTFIKAVSPLVSESKGLLSVFNINEQVRIIDNYYKAFRNVFPSSFNHDQTIFFKTTGFGAIFKVFPTIFNYCIKHEKGFTVNDVSKVLRKVAEYNFEEWKTFGTGNAAEIRASEELREEIENAFSESDGSTKIRL